MNLAIISAILSAILYAICIPFAKMMTPYVESITLGGLLYLGAGTGLGITQIFAKSCSNPLSKKELPFIFAIVGLDITTIFAYVVFKERLSKKLILAVIIILTACIILTMEKTEGLIFNQGSVFVLISGLCWGLENNCTRKISSKSTKQITAIKGICSGIGSLILAMIFKENIPAVKYIIPALLLGFVSYGLSVALYIYAQRFLGAVKTGAYYSLAPFFGVIFCLVFLKELPGLQFYIALIFMILGTFLVIRDSKNS